MEKDFDDIRPEIAARLTRAAKDRRSPMHTPSVVTSDIDARIMVLREFDSAAWTLRFHTDTRAPKVAAIRNDPRMAVLFYDKGAKIQIRASGIGRIESEGPVADRAWNAASNFARRCYLGDGPGTRGDAPLSGLPPEFEGVEPTDEQIVPARPNFAVLLFAIERIDWLYLAHTGHVRARFERSGDEWTANWLSP